MLLHHISHMCISILNVLQVLLACVEVVEVQPKAIAPVVFLNGSRLLVEETQLSFAMRGLSSLKVYQARLIALVDTLDVAHRCLDPSELCLNAQHAEVLLDADRCALLDPSELLGLAQHVVVVLHDTISLSEQLL